MPAVPDSIPYFILSDERDHLYVFESKLRTLFSGPLDRIARVIGKTGISPDTLTLIGLAITVLSAAAIADGSLCAGGFIAAVAGIFDALDGALARNSGRQSSFGAFLDSCTDRYTEIILYFGLLLFFFREPGNVLPLILIFIVITGSLMVSYTRARAESLGAHCRGGITARAERIALLILGLVTGYIVPALMILAVLTHLTALQRVLAVYREIGNI
jgi:CDP-diacylglycerol--glycerol-3-phosphate 3-phosphatidyltransferase